MKILFIIGQEEDGRYVSIPVHEDLGERTTTPGIYDLDGSDEPSGIIETITPEQEAEEDRVKEGGKAREKLDLGKILKKAGREDEMSEEGV